MDSFTWLLQLTPDLHINNVNTSSRDTPFFSSVLCAYTEFAYATSYPPYTPILLDILDCELPSLDHNSTSPLQHPGRA